VILGAFQHYQKYLTQIQKISRSRFKSGLVDEMKDSSFLQYEFIEKIFPKNFPAVGDDEFFEKMISEKFFENESLFRKVL
jgi:hypothetical protein